MPVNSVATKGRSSGNSKKIKISNYSGSNSPTNVRVHSPKEKVPNLDLIEDVSRASQVLPHELIHTHQACLVQADPDTELIAIQNPYTAPDSPIAPPQPTAIVQNTAIGFHRGMNLQYELIATSSSFLN